MKTLWQDTRYALRGMGRNRAFTAIAVLALALGMGANTAMFTVVDAVLVNSAPIKQLRDPSRLVMLWEKNPSLGLTFGFAAERMQAAPANFEQWQHQSRSFEDMTAFIGLQCDLARRGAVRPERVEALRIQPNLFPLLGVQLGAGRNFTSEETTSAGDVVLLSAKLYRQRFGADRNLAGKIIRVDGKPRRIAGVLPEGFEFPAMWGGANHPEPDILLPLDLSHLNKDAVQSRAYYIYARLRPGATLQSARQEMRVVAKRLEKQNPDFDDGWTVTAFPVAEEDVDPDLRRNVLVLQIAVGFVLLIACANVANLMLARAAGRAREVAVRLALGATRGRIVRQMLTESLLTGLLGGLAGLLLALWSLDAISALAPKDAHGLHELRIDSAVLAFTFLVTLAASLFFGLAPALHAVREDVNRRLAQGGRSVAAASNRLRGALVVSEVALAFVLLAGAGLMIRSLLAIMNVDPGFRTDHLLTVEIGLSPIRYADTARTKVFGDRLLESVERLPGVQSASISSALPMERVTENSFRLEGDPPKPKHVRLTLVSSVSERYFETLGVPLRLGRIFTRNEAEAADPGVVVVSDSFARENWPKQDPLGKIVLLGDGNSQTKPRVIGVVGGIHEMGPDSVLTPELFSPSRADSDVFLAVRTSGNPMALTHAVERAVWSIDPDQPVEPSRVMERMGAEWPEDRRFVMTILAVFAALALVLASLGLYGVLAYVVTLRTRELGIRIALGAAPGDVQRLVVGQGLKLTLVGIVFGFGGAFALTRAMSTMIFAVTATDPLTLAFVAALLAAVAVAASYIPARRAARVDPMEALRVE